MVGFSKSFSIEDIAAIMGRWKLAYRSEVWVVGVPARESLGVQNDDGFWVSVSPSRDGSALWFSTGGIVGKGITHQKFQPPPKVENPNWYRDKLQALGPNCAFTVRLTNPQLSKKEVQSLYYPSIAEGIVAWSRLGGESVTPVVHVESLEGAHNER